MEKSPEQTFLSLTFATCRKDLPKTLTNKRDDVKAATTTRRTTLERRFGTESLHRSKAKAEGWMGGREAIERVKNCCVGVETLDDEEECR